MIIGTGLVVFPGYVAKRAKEDFQPAQFLGQEHVAARLGDQVVQPAIESAGLLNEAPLGARFHGAETSQFQGQILQLGQVDAPACRAHRLAFQRPPHLANLAYLMRRDLAHDRAAVGQEIDDANSGQGDQCLADRSMADTIAPGKLLSN